MNTPSRQTPLGADYPLLHQARTLWMGGKMPESLALFSSAVEQHPHSVRALIEAARAFGQAYEILKAERLLTAASELAGDSPEVAALIAQSYRMMHRPDQAIAAFRRIIEQKTHRSPDVYFELAALYERTSHTDQAREAICQCLAGNPEWAEPQLLLARIERRCGAVAEAQRLLRALSVRTTLTPMLRAQVLTELAGISDSEGDYEGAWATTELAKGILRQQPAAIHLSKMSVSNNELLRRLYTKLTSRHLRRWRDQAPEQDPRVGGVGHLLGFPRTGTTLLEQVLDAHPALISSQERVIFSRDIFMSMYQVNGDEPMDLSALDTVPADRLLTHRRRYLDLMEEALGEPLAGRFHLDKNPNHTSLMAGLYRLFPESKFIVALRDPRDILVSCYLHWFPLTEFSAAFLTPGSACQVYAFEMSVWLKMKELMPDGWREVRYEDTIADLPGQARRTLEFLGLPWDESVLNYRERLHGRRINSPTHEAVRQPIYQHASGRWRNYGKQLGPYFDRLQPFLDAFNY
jgi:Tfp pilus assembly protein PilF